MAVGAALIVRDFFRAWANGPAKHMPPKSPGIRIARVINPTPYAGVELGETNLVANNASRGASR